MEDIKKIQEFFSKPLNENKVTKEDFDKVVKVLSTSKYPFTIMLVPKWDEIDIITGQDSPDEISDDISQRLDSAGLNWGGNSGITISGDSSNYSRREYSDIFKVNGGHKDYYEESYASSFGGFRKELDGETIENELQSKGYDTPNTGIWNRILVTKDGKRVGMINTDESSYMKDGKIYKWEGTSDFISHVESINEGAVEIMDAFNDVMDLVKKHSRNLSDDDSYAFALKLKAWFNKNILDEAKVEVDDETEFKLDLKHLLDKHVVEATKEEETEFHAKLDKLVHDTFGKRKSEMEEYNSGIYFNPDKSSPRPKVKDGAKSGVEKVKDMLKKIMKENKDAELKVGDYQTKYFYICPGAKSLYQDIEDKVEDMGLAVRAAKLQDALFAIEASALESGATEAEVFAAQSIADQIMAMAAMMGLDKEHSYIQGHVEKIKGAVGKEQVAESSTSEERRIAKRAIRSIAKYRGVSEDEARNDLIRAANELGSLEKAVREMFETIKLGKQLNEELCDKGKRYIKARQAAGEKSSAYLSGRAVRVCKGQIEWPKKGKKK